MEIRELAELADRVIDRTVPWLEARAVTAPYAASVRGANRAGEWQIALENLVGVLAYEHIPVRADDHRDLKKLFNYFATSRSEEVRERADASLSDLAKITIF